MVKEEFKWFLLSSLSSNIVYALMAPFYPQIAQEKQVDNQIVGIIFSIYSLFGMIASPVCVKMISAIGRKQTCVLACLLIFSSCILFSQLQHFGYKWFVIISLITRSMKGFGNGILSALVYASAFSHRKEEATQLLAYIEFAQAGGIIIGVYIGTFVYSYYGFSGPFIFWGIFIALIVPFIMKIKLQEEKNEVFSPLQESKTVQISLFQSFFLKRAFLNALAIIVMSWSCHMIEPFILSSITKYSPTSITIATIFSMSQIGYICGLPVATKLAFKLDDRLTVILGYAGVFLGCALIIGPEYLWMVGLGLFISSAFNSLGCIPAIGDIQTGIKIRFPKVSDSQVSNIVGAITNVSFNASKIIGPLLGAWIFDNFNFIVLVNFVLISQLICGLFYILLLDFKDIIRKSLPSQVKDSTDKNPINENGRFLPNLNEMNADKKYQ